MINNPPYKKQIQGRTPTGVQMDTGWANFFRAVAQICSAQEQAGTTANRPTTGLYIGRRYFDSTLGKPVWYTAAGWVDATGSVV